MALPQFLCYTYRVRVRLITGILSIRKLGLHQTKRNYSCRRAFFGSANSSRFKCRHFASRGVYLFGVLGTVKSWFHSTEKDTERKKIADTVREAILSYRDGDAPRSIDLLHGALSVAQEMNDERAVNYICDLLGNIYYELMDTAKAKALFLSVTERLIASGAKKTDPAIVEISLKLADIYAMEGDHELAEEGFKFCIETQKLAVKDMDNAYDKLWFKKFKVTRSSGLGLPCEVIGTGPQKEDIFNPCFKVFFRSDDEPAGEELSDPYALYGMILETYSRYLLSRKRVEESKKHFSRALELARDLYSPISAHVIIMMNNYAVECAKHGEYELARTYHSEVVYRAVHCRELEWQLPAFYCNYAETLWHCGQRKEAIEMAERALSLASSGDKNVLKHVKEFCDSLRKDKSPSSASVRSK